MNMPGFTAEASLRPNAATHHQYRSGLIAENQSVSGGVTPSIRNVPSHSICGECTELKWPNGTGTGACSQSCCDLRLNCKTKSCSCPSGTTGGSLANWGALVTTPTHTAFHP